MNLRNLYASRLLAHAALPNPDESKPWFRCQAGEGGEPSTIDIMDDIGLWGLTAQDFLAELRQLPPGDLDVHINSYGGEVFDGVTIYNALSRREGNIRVYVDGLAASIASVIAMAGDEIVMARGASIFVHNAWSLAVGNAADLRKAANDLEVLDYELAQIYAHRTGKSLPDIEALMAADTLMVGSNAVELGFADRVEGEKAGPQASLEVPFDPKTQRRRMRASLVQRLANPGAPRRS